MHRRDKTVRVWDVKTGKYEHTLDGHSGVGQQRGFLA
jgi:WD40 repeat protein